MSFLWSPVNFRGFPNQAVYLPAFQTQNKPQAVSGRDGDWIWQASDLLDMEAQGCGLLGQGECTPDSVMLKIAWVTAVQFLNSF